MLRALTALAPRGAISKTAIAARSIHSARLAMNGGAVLPSKMAIMPSAVCKPIPLRRLLHTSRPVLSAAASEKTPYQKQTDAYNKIDRQSIHVLDAPSITTWQEIPKGGPMRGPDVVWKIWYNHAVVPIYIVVVFAAGLCGFFLYKYFTAHTEIAFGKTMRSTYDHQGLSEHRANAHDRRLLYPGMRERNKRDVKMFPFNFIPMQEIAKNRFVDYNKGDDE